MTPEQSAWAAVQPHLSAANLDPHRVENVLSPGHPDVNYAGGDIELKALAEWPVRPETPVRIETFTGEQAGFLARRWSLRGAIWLLVRVGREWFLFDGWTALQVRSGLTQAEWREQAAWSHNGRDGWNSPGPRGREGPSALTRLAYWLRLDLDEMSGPERARACRLTCFLRGLHPKTPGEVANDLGWSVHRLYQTELGQSKTTDLDDLLAYWEN